MDREHARSGLERVAQVRNNARVASRRALGDECRLRLARTMATKLKTTMVGSIAAAEEIFGFLTGRAEPPDWMTCEEAALFRSDAFQSYMAEEWDRFRRRVFDLGNAQIRNAGAELDQYDVNWTRYRYRIDQN